MLASTLLVLFCAQAPAPVSVTVRETTSRKSTTYTYRVVNRTQHRIVAVRIGYDSGRQQPQLATLPAGWTFQGGLAANTAGGPAGWSVRLVTTEENPKFMLEWSSEHAATSDIAPGKSASGFRIRLPRAAPEYRKPMFEVELDDATRQPGIVKLER